MSHKLVSLYIGDGEYYTRTDADAVIKELKAQKAQAEDDCAYWKMSEGNAVAAMHETEEYAMQLYNELRHQKYKRCLDNAERCRLEQERIELIENQDITDDDFNKLVKGFYKKWRERWLKIAEQLKEAK